MNGDGLVTRTTWSSASCIDSTKVFTAISSPSFVQILWAGPWLAKSACSFSLMASKLASHILCVGKALALRIGRLSTVMIGRWSAWGGQMEGSTLHKVIGSFGLLLCQTSLGHVQLEVVVSYVGISGGSAIIMLCSVMRLISGLIMLVELYRCQLLLVSQRGW